MDAIASLAPFDTTSGFSVCLLPAGPESESSRRLTIGMFRHRAARQRGGVSAVASRNAVTIATIDPSTGETVKAFEPYSGAEVEARLSLAAEAADSHRRTSYEQRGRWMQAL